MIYQQFIELTKFLLMYRKSAVCDQPLESTGPASGAASKRGLPAKSNRLTETTGKKNVSSTKDGSRVKSTDQGQVAAESLQNKAAISKLRFGQDYSEILTTDICYYSSAAHGAPENELVDGTEVLGTGSQDVICHLDNSKSKQVK